MPVESGGVAYAPVAMDEQKAAQTSQRLSQPDLSMLEEVYAEEGAAQQVPASRTEMRLLLVGMLCCSGVMGLVILGLIAFLIVKVKK
jgi:hypothetical protein